MNTQTRACVLASAFLIAACAQQAQPSKTTHLTGSGASPDPQAAVMHYYYGAR